MKWIKDPATGREMLGLLPDEAHAVSSLLKYARRNAAKKFEHYSDLHEAGEATDSQQTFMVVYANEMEFIDKFTHFAE